MNTSLWLIFEKVSFFPARAFSTHNFLCVHFIHLVHIVIDTHIHSLSNLCLIFTINLSKNNEFLKLKLKCSRRQPSFDWLTIWYTLIISVSDPDSDPNWPMRNRGSGSASSWCGSETLLITRCLPYLDARSWRSFRGES